MTKVKICCIQSIEEAQMAIDNGVYAIGLVSQMPSGPGVISEEKIRELTKRVPDNIKTVMLTSLQNADELVTQIDYCKPDIVQLVDSQNAETYETLHMIFPDLEIMQVIHVVDENSIFEAIDVAQFVDFILLDSGNPNLQIKVLGGTGKTHNWEYSKKININVDIPVFLAGGLKPENVAEAVKTVKPFGVDVCSRLRNDGNLDESKLKMFMENMR
jgi:phosphoribosylanthranilate isomerase